MQRPKLINGFTCGSCKFSALMTNPDDSEKLICRFNPPASFAFLLWHDEKGRPVPPNEAGTPCVPVPHVNVLFQAVDPAGWCGQHKPKITLE